MKKILTMIVLMALMSLIPVSVFADTDNVIARGKLGDKVTWVLYDDGILEVSGTGKTRASYPLSWNLSEEQVNSITKIVINEGITNIDDSTFKDLKNLTGTLIIPSSVKRVGRFAFLGCDFTEVVLPDSLEVIDAQAFQNNSNLRKMNIPDDLNTLGRSVFSGCVNLGEFTCKSSCKNYKVKNNIIYDRNMTTLVYYPKCFTAESFTVPSGIKRVEQISNKNLKKIILPEGLEEIGYGAFSINTNMLSMDIPSSVKKIGESAFHKCSKITTITLPESLESIGRGAFTYCYNLKEVTFRSKNCNIEKLDLNRKAMIKGYVNSTAHEYAMDYGYGFKNIDNGYILSERRTNDMLISMLPLSGIVSSIPEEAHSYQLNADPGYMNVDEEIRQEVADKTTEITKDCKTDYEKVKAIYRFVNSHMSYEWGWELNLYGAWKEAVGNCATYTLLTSTMLYDAGIPYAYAYTVDHVFNLALCEGRWVDVDSTGIFDRGGNAHDDITKIILRSGNLIYRMEDTKGLKLAGIGNSFSNVDETIMKKGIVIPDWVNGADKRSLEYYDGIVVKGTKGKGAEKAAKELGYQCMSGSGSKLIAYKEHDYEPTEVIKKATPKQDGESICKCSRCNTVETVKFAQVDYCFAGELWRYAYTGKPIEPEPYVEDYDNKEVDPKYYSVTYKNNLNPGEAVMTVRFKGPYSGTMDGKFTIVKLKNTIKTSDANMKVKASRLRKKSKTVAASKVIIVKDAIGTIRYTKIKGSSKITIKKDKITVRKGTRKGTYNIKVRVTATGNKYYRGKSQDIQLTVNVR